MKVPAPLPSSNEESSLDSRKRMSPTTSSSEIATTATQ